MTCRRSGRRPRPRRPRGPAAHVSSPMKPSRGKAACRRRGDQALGLAVDLGQVILRALEGDAEGGVEEAAPGERAGFARDRLGREQAQGDGASSRSFHPVSLRNGCRSRARSSSPRRRGRRRAAARRPRPLRRRASTATPAARPRASKPARPPADGGEDFVIVAAGQRDLEQGGIGRDRRARGGRQRQTRELTRALRPLTRSILSRSPTKPSETSMPPWAQAAIAGASATRGRGSEIAVEQKIPVGLGERRARPCRSLQADRGVADRAGDIEAVAGRDAGRAAMRPGRTAPKRRDRKGQRARRLHRVAAEQRAADRRAASAPRPGGEAASQAAVQSRGSASDSRKPSGRAPLAARSERFTRSALRAIAPADRRRRNARPPPARRSSAQGPRPAGGVGAPRRREAQARPGRRAARKSAR